MHKADARAAEGSEARLRDVGLDEPYKRGFVALVARSPFP
jgi:hypothetical protein